MRQTLVSLRLFLALALVVPLAFGAASSVTVADTHDPYDHASQESCPRTPGMIIGRPQIAANYVEGKRVPEFSWTTKCQNLSGFRIGWAFAFPDESRSGVGAVETAAYSYAPPEPANDEATGIFVSVFDKDGFGGVGYSSTGVVPLQVIPPSAPGAPSLIDNGSSRVTASWAASGTTGGAEVNYAVQTVPKTAGCVTTETSCVLVGLRPDVTYQVSIAASNSAGLGGVSETNRITPESPRLLAPRRVTAKASGNQIRVAWKPPAGKTTGTKVRYKVASKPRGLACKTVKTKCILRQAAPGKTYSFVVTAIRGPKKTKSAPSPSVVIPLPPQPEVAPDKKPTQDIS